MGKQIYVDEAYRTFTEAVAGALDGKEGMYVQLDVNGQLELSDGTRKCIGTMFSKLQGSSDVSVRLAGKGGTVKVVQGAPINMGDYVAPDATARAYTPAAASGINRTFGIKISPTTAGAVGDVIEVLDTVEQVTF